MIYEWKPLYFKNFQYCPGITVKNSNIYETYRISHVTLKMEATVKNWKRSNQLIQRIHFYQQGSLSRAFGLRPRSEKASPSSSSDTGSLASQYMSSARSNSPPPPQLPPRPITGNKRHRRVKSIGDIDYITSAAVSTPV